MNNRSCQTCSLRLPQYLYKNLQFLFPTQNSVSCNTVQFSYHTLASCSRSETRTSPSCSSLRWLVQDTRACSSLSFSHLHAHEIVAKPYTVFKVGFHDVLLILLLVSYQLHVTVILNVLHSLTKHAVIHQLEKIFLKLVLGCFPKLRVFFDLGF